MATDNNKKLTRYTSAVTIVTADTMNKLYGGEFGFNESADEFDPLVFGHVHDGKHEDGHASKILLTSGAHIRGYLGNANLGGTDGTTPAVRYSNILCYSDAVYGSPAARRAAAAAGGFDLEILAIPEYTEDPVTGERCYYLDLSNSAGGIDGSIQFNEAGAFSGNQDLFYDYTNERFGLGTNTPIRKAHIVDDSNPPLRIEGISAGSGTVLVVDGNGDIYSDASIGPDQNLYNTIELTDLGGGTQSGDTTLTADTTTETLTLSAGANITLDGDEASDTITISSTGGTPGGSYRSIQFHDNLVPAGFAGDDALAYNDVPGGLGAIGPEIVLRNTQSSVSDEDRYSALRFRGTDGPASRDVALISAQHYTYGNVSFENAGSLSLGTVAKNSALTTPALRKAIYIDGGQTSADNRGHVGIGAVNPAAPLTTGGFKTPARRLHVLEDGAGTFAPGYSPLRINPLRDGVGQLMVWDNGIGDPWDDSATVPYHEGDVYYVPNGNENDILKINSSGYPEWGAAETAARKFSSQWVGVESATPESGLGVSLKRRSRYNVLVGEKTIGYQYKADYTPIPLSDPQESLAAFYINVPIPFDGELNQAAGSSTSGSFQGGLDLYSDPVPQASTDAPTSCRITAYFVLDRTGEALPSGSPASTVSGGADFSVNVQYGGSISGITPNRSIVEVQDGALLQTDPSIGNQLTWISNASADALSGLTNEHSYAGNIGPPPSGDVSDGMLVVSDFSALKINTSPNTDGIATFKISVTGAGGSFFATFADNYAPMNDEDTLSCIRFMGARILWIWE